VRALKVLNISTTTYRNAFLSETPGCNRIQKSNKPTNKSKNDLRISPSRLPRVERGAKSVLPHPQPIPAQAEGELHFDNCHH
jgi:hypothetical protein